jgi:hypothetical protein
VSDTLRLYTAKELELAAREAGFRHAAALCYREGRALSMAEGGTCGRIMLVARK